MAKNKSLSQLKEVIDLMIDKNGNFRAVPRGYIGKQELSGDRLRLMEMILRLFLETDFLNPETRLYLSNRYITIAGVRESMINNGLYDNGELTESAVRNRIYRDQAKIESVFGDSFISDILMSNVKPIARYTEALGKEFAKSGDNELKKGVRLNLAEDIISTSIDDDEFDEFVEIIQPYLEPQMRFIEENLSARAVGYFNYVMGCPDKCLSATDLERKNKLITLLTGIVDASDAIDFANLN